MTAFNVKSVSAAVTRFRDCAARAVAAIKGRPTVFAFVNEDPELRHRAV